MPVRAIKNQYVGINAHLHSFWQGEGGWARFHGNHISDIMRLIRPPLMRLGYVADLEPSVQIRRLDTAEEIGEPESNIAIYDLDVPHSTPRSISPQTAGELVIPIYEAVIGQPLSAKQYSAIKIYDVIENKIDPGRLVAWIELLSPSNKPGGRDARAYADKRERLLQAGIVVVELESSPTLYAIPDYRTRRGKPGDASASAYRIALLDPRPRFEEALAHVYTFGVDVPFPRAQIPLNRDDMLDFDFGLPYVKTFEETLYGLERVDYAELPLNFDRYSPDDQARIARRLVATCEAAVRGDDLEVNAPFAIDGSLTLDTALARLNAARAKLAGAHRINRWHISPKPSILFPS
jgi:hypothetical protein